MMGQAKQRGTREQRIAEAAAARGLIERPIAEVKAQLGLPEDAEFLGYGVHLPTSDEFLVSFDNKDGAIRKAWYANPDHAMTFDNIADAGDVSEKCKGSVVVGMFDIGSQIVVFDMAIKA